MAVDNEDLEAAVALLRAGGVIIFPTETLYGIGCDALNEAALDRLFRIKQRAPGQPPPCLVSGPGALPNLVVNLPEHARDLIAAHWPGALTLVLRARSGLPAQLVGRLPDGQPTIGVRQSAHPVAAVLCERLGHPLVATSANFSGSDQVADSIEVIPTELRRQVDLVLDAGRVAGHGSTVVDCTGPLAKVIRA